MGIPFDHTQRPLDANMILGAAESDVIKTGTFTDEEFFRTWINPGLTGVISFLEAHLEFQGFSTPGTALVTYKWEIRPTGQAAWVNVFTSTSVAWPTNLVREADVIFDPSGDLEDDAPFELRLLITTEGAETVDVTLVAINSSVRVVGESI